MLCLEESMRRVYSQLNQEMRIVISKVYALCTAVVPAQA